MKVEWKKLLFGLAIGAGMTMMVSCTQDEMYDPGGGEGKEKPESTETAYFSLGLSTGAVARTRVAAPIEELGRQEEQVVNHVRMVLYELQNETARYVWDLDAHTDGQNPFTGSSVSQEQTAEPTVSRFVTVAEEVIRQPYKLLILINPPMEMIENTEKGKAMSYLSLPVTYPKASLTADAGLAKDGEFFMANHQGLIDVTEGDLKEDASTAEKNPKKVEVERAVAKVVVLGDPVVPAGDRIGNLTWGLDVTNIHTYWLRRMTYIANSGGVPHEMEIVGSGDRSERYAEDPNFSGFTRWNGIGNPDGQFEYLPLGNAPLPNEFGYDFYDYVLENTMEAQEQRHDVTTRVVIRATYVPQGIEPIPTRGFINGYSYYTFKGYAITTYNMSRYVSNPDNILPELKAAGLAEAIVAAQAVNPTLFNNPQTSFSEAGINFYYEGVCYYTVLIRHFSDGQVPVLMGYGRYGVVRNNVYKLTINSISGPGKAVIEEPGTDPDDDETGWISADVHIMPWYIRGQVVEEL